ncbi:Iron-binding zinc finger, CDGSH type [Dillenia turbinata]|uniref:Iron-binding zinc finger, CDGSH type n=1 Tax=Dillenia turbinata TaxID=194707 RepID=A0AAN8ZD97_9MAGN
MASIVSMVGCGLSYNSLEGLKRSKEKTFGGVGVSGGGKGRRSVLVRAETINPEIRKSEEKVVDSVIVTELSKPLTAYCRCWRSGTFPLCDGSHVKHNKATGDNVGPLLLKKQ